MSNHQTTLTGIDPDIRVYSIGYGGRTLNELDAILTRHKVEKIVDVRSRPNTKWMGRQTLEQKLGSNYISVPELGGKDYTPHEYERWYKEVPRKKMQALAELSTKYIICLLCAERDHVKCHRFYFVAKMLNDQYGITVMHL